MEIFINELSLEGQYHTDTEFTDAVKTIVELLNLLQNKIPEKVFFRTDLLKHQPTIQGEILSASVQRLKEPVKEQFRRLVFNNSQDWIYTKKQEEDADYFYFPHIDRTKDIQNLSIQKVNQTTLAEISERILQKREGTLIVINFSNSKFAKSDLTTIFKIQNEGQKDLIEVLSFDDRNSLETWLELEYEFSKTEYDYDSQIPPTDQQTILRDTTKFKATSYKVQGRTVYEELRDGTYWYVDNLHYSTASHLEVFNPNTDTHLGEANLEGILDESKADEKKKIKRYLS